MEGDSTDKTISPQRVQLLDVTFRDEHEQVQGQAHPAMFY